MAIWLTSMTQTKIIRRSQPIPDYVHGTVAGIDEAGRGALAGPVVAAAVVFDGQQTIDGCDDSKMLSAKRREELSREIKKKALAWVVEYADLREIETYNVLHATMRAMARAIKSLGIVPEMVLVDGNRLPDVERNSYAVIGGDARVCVISAASILAKVARDHTMRELHRKYPNYQFGSNKGYGTKAHIEALHRHGKCDMHRSGWRSVQRCLSAELI